MERVAAILVDAGYVWKQIAKVVGERNPREVVLVRSGLPLIEALVEEAEGDDLTVLRTYWYDAAGERGPNVQQRAVGRAARVKLRLGTISYGRQKGVDRLIQKDILALASNKAVTDIILISGDQDMEEEVDIAGQHGVLMHIWGISDQDQQDQISGRLLRVADEWRVFAYDWAETFVWAHPGGEGTDAVAAQPPLSSDAALEALRGKLLGLDVQPGEVPAGSDDPVDEALPRLDRLTTSEQLIDTGRAAYDSLKEQHGAEWASIRAEVAQSFHVLHDGRAYRNIPGIYDTELMDTVEAIVGGRITSSADRNNARTGFWLRFDEDE